MAAAIDVSIPAAATDYRNAERSYASSTVVDDAAISRVVTRVLWAVRCLYAAQLTEVANAASIRTNAQKWLGALESAALPTVGDPDVNTTREARAVTSWRWARASGVNCTAAQSNRRVGNEQPLVMTMQPLLP